ncbi:MAG: recombinase family protein [Rikenellaceae bacterium]
MTKGYIGQVDTVAKLQDLVLQFNKSGVKSDDIIINNNFNAVVDIVNDGDIILVMSFAELFGSITELFANIIMLAERRVTLRSIEEPLIVVNSQQVEFIKTLNELNGKMRTIRTKCGLQKAKANGKTLGRPVGTTKVDGKVLNAIKLHKESSLSIEKACAIAGCKPRTYYRYLTKMDVTPK